MIKTGGKNRYCGPYAIGYLAGINSDEAAKAIRKVSGQRAVKMTYSNHISPALTNLGIKHKTKWFWPDPVTWKKWRNNFMRGKGLYLVLITGHFIIVDAGVIKDNHEFNGTLAKDMPARKKVLAAWEISPTTINHKLPTETK